MLPYMTQAGCDLAQTYSWVDIENKPIVDPGRNLEEVVSCSSDDKVLSSKSSACSRTLVPTSSKRSSSAGSLEYSEVFEAFIAQTKTEGERESIAKRYVQC